MNNRDEWMKTELKRENRQEEVPQSRTPTPKALWVAIAGLAVALAALAAYDYVALGKHGLRLADLSAVEESLTALTKQVQATDAKLRSYDWNGLVDRMTKLDGKVTTSLRLARKQAQEMVTQAEDRIQAELDERARATDARFVHLESKQEVDGARLAELQKELDDTRQQVAAFREGTNLDLAGLRAQMAHSGDQLNQLIRQRQRQRVTFELAKNYTLEIVPGIRLRVLRTDVRYQRFDGWIWFLPDRRFLWMNGQGVQRPVVFYPQQGGDPFELVVDGVREGGVVGYLALPAAASGVATVAPQPNDLPTRSEKPDTAEQGKETSGINP